MQKAPNCAKGKNRSRKPSPRAATVKVLSFFFKVESALSLAGSRSVRLRSRNRGGGSSKVLGSDRRLEAIEAAAKRLRGSPAGQRVRSI